MNNTDNINNINNINNDGLVTKIIAFFKNIANGGLFSQIRVYQII